MSSTFFPGSTGGLSASHSRSGSTTSPMRFSSPSKRFGYMRWPPLISPTSELLTTAYDDYADVRFVSCNRAGEGGFRAEERGTIVYSRPSVCEGKGGLIAGH